MIIEVALGVVLGVLILVFWRELIALGITVLLAVLALAILLIAGYFLYDAVQSAKASPIWQAINSTIAFIAPIGLNIMFAFAIGHVIEQRTSLRGKEAYILGSVFFLLFLVSAIAAPWLFLEHWNDEPKSALLYLGALLAAWFIAFSECRRRIKRRRLQLPVPR